MGVLKAVTTTNLTRMIYEGNLAKLLNWLTKRNNKVLIK
jgi:hypothetical protein